MSTTVSPSPVLKQYSINDRSVISGRRNKLQGAFKRIFSRVETMDSESVPYTLASTRPEIRYSTNAKHNSQISRRLPLSKCNSPELRSHDSKIDQIFETWEDWIEMYQRGDANLSNISRPECFGGFGYMCPPNHCKEAARLQVLHSIEHKIDCVVQIKQGLQHSLQKILDEHRLKMATVSFVGEEFQSIHFSIGMNKKLTSISKTYSLDAHTLLTLDYLAILDASADWRTRLNPLVSGPPFIKFYLGIPIIVNGLPIGSIAVLDPYCRVQVNPTLLEKLSNLTSKFSRKIEAVLNTEHGAAEELSEVDELQSALSSIVLDSNSILDLSCKPSNQHSDEIKSKAISTEVSIRFSEIERRRSLGSRVHRAPQRQVTYQQLQVLASLMSCRGVTHAFKKTCQIVQKKLDASIVYVAEIRHKKCGSKVESKARLISYYAKSAVDGDAKTQIERIMIKDFKLLHAAMSSQYGVKCSSMVTESIQKDGILVPFHRSTEDTHNKQPGAFVLAAFSDVSQKFSIKDILFAKQVLKSLEGLIPEIDDCSNE
ncbi:hypothetical protein DASB73_012740 [Starmerella bacillaris]|uniref:Uncharacterized protein n=1 Tax=Starmerella bacillaris TaxID=1247836 RepID=A0AAV5RGL1_STABA|nr:hypothetical protein DASB73_012740 [Starmerella bacillaris]